MTEKRFLPQRAQSTRRFFQRKAAKDAKCAKVFGQALVGSRLPSLIPSLRSAHFAPWQSRDGATMTSTARFTRWLRSARHDKKPFMPQSTRRVFFSAESRRGFCGGMSVVPRPPDVDPSLRGARFAPWQSRDGGTTACTAHVSGLLRFARNVLAMTKVHLHLFACICVFGGKRPPCALWQNPSASPSVHIHAAVRRCRSGSGGRCGCLIIVRASAPSSRRCGRPRKSG